MRDDLIYDVGMHTGEDTEFYLRKGFRVVGIEANAQLCEECAHKFSAAIGSGQLQIINKAISHTVGTIDFFLNEQVSIWGTANLEWVKRNEARGFKSHPVKVEATQGRHSKIRCAELHESRYRGNGFRMPRRSAQRKGEAQVYFGGGKRDVDQGHVHATASARSAGIHEIQDCPTTQYY
jgi:hypothetical protein